jgi:hypothetical protein
MKRPGVLMAEKSRRRWRCFVQSTTNQPRSQSDPPRTGSEQMVLILGLVRSLPLAVFADFVRVEKARETQ